jgi:hypothetical protein
MERRREPGSLQGLTCGLDVEGRRHHGIVLSVESQSLLVHTRAKPPRDPEAPVTVSLRLPKSPAMTIFQTHLTRYRPVPSRLVRVAGGSMGLSIPKVPEAWSEFVDGKRLVTVKSPIHSGDSAAPSEQCSDRIEIGTLPPISKLPRQRCRSCNRDGRSLWSGLCGWCCD